MSNRVRWALIGIAIVVVAAGIAAAVVLIPVFRDSGPVPVEAQVTIEQIINQVETDRPGEAGTGASNFLPAQIGQELVGAEWWERQEGEGSQISGSTSAPGQVWA